MRSICCLFLAVLVLCGSSHAQLADPGPQIEKVVSAVGGKDKLLKIFRIKEIYHFGEKPEPDAGKKRSIRESVLEMPGWWWVNKKERGDEPAKFDVWAWTLGVLVDEKSKVESIPGLSDEGRATFGLRVSGTVDPAMDLYFDKETSLLLRLDWRADIYRFSEWKEHDGVKYASKTVIYKKASEKPWFYHEVTELERLKALPEGIKHP
jgi:hypothetical protein